MTKAPHNNGCCQPKLLAKACPALTCEGIAPQAEGAQRGVEVSPRDLDLDGIGVQAACQLVGGQVGHHHVRHDCHADGERPCKHSPQVGSPMQQLFCRAGGRSVCHVLHDSVGQRQAGSCCITGVCSQ